MPNLPWYNENEFRDYPFLTRTAPFVLARDTPETGIKPSVLLGGVLVQPTSTDPVPTNTSSSSSVSATSIGGTTGNLPHSTVLDFGAIFEIDAGYDEEQGHYVYLHSISRNGSFLTFRFRTNAPDSINHELVFERNAFETDFVIDWVDAVTFIAEPVDPLVCTFLPKWSGFKNSVANCVKSVVFLFLSSDQ